MTFLGCRPARRDVAKTFSMLVIFIGALVTVGWVLDIPFLKTIMPGFVSMKLNTAVSFLLAGSALRLLLQRPQRISSRLTSRACVAVVFLLSFLNLSEYFFASEVSVHQGFFIDLNDIYAGRYFFGRMAVITAVNFFFLSGGLALLHLRFLPLRAVILTALPPFFVSLGGMAGYLFNVPGLYMLIGSTAMAVHTTVAFFLLSLAVLMTAFEFQAAAPPREGPQSSFSQGALTRLFVLALFIFLVIAAASYRNTALLLDASDLRVYTYKVLESIQTLFFQVVNAESKNRGYLITNNERNLDLYNQSKEAVRGDLAELERLAVDNPRQQLNLSRLRPLIAERMRLLDENVRLYREGGFPVVREHVAGVIRSGITQRIGDMARTMIDEKHHLLAKRDYNVQVSVRNTYATLLVGNVVSFILIGLVFYRLREEIREREKTAAAVEESREKFRRLFEFLPDAVLVVDHEGRILQMNQQAENMFDHQRVEMIGRPVESLIPPRYREQHVRHRNAYFADSKIRGMGVGLDLYGQRKDGEEFPVDIMLSPLETIEGRQTVAIVRNITERKKSEQKIQELNKELERRFEEAVAANKELESFSYSVSHDLRAPLRAVDGFSRIVLEEYAGRLDAEGNRLLGVIRTNTQRMGLLIDNLLAFSRTSRKEVVLSKVEMKSLVLSVVDELKKFESERAVSVAVGDLPPARGDHAMMRQVWANLISNAFKFTRRVPSPRVEIDSRLDRGHNVYWVRDNGAGFDMRYAGKLFGVFQRLHAEEEFEGTGVGLALVGRIISKHGGRVWAEGKIDKGAVFYFTLSA